MASDAERTRRYLLLFGLNAGYTAEELSAAYRAMALLNHPDVSDDPHAGMRMIIVNEAYAFLKNRPSAPVSSEPGPPIRDSAYLHYRAGFDMMKAALSDYFGESADKSGVSDITRLRDRLQAAKRSFAEVVAGPYNDWTSDAIDRIASINVWLGEP